MVSNQLQKSTWVTPNCGQQSAVKDSSSLENPPFQNLLDSFNMVDPFDSGIQPSINDFPLLLSPRLPPPTSLKNRFFPGGPDISYDSPPPFLFSPNRRYHEAIYKLQTTFKS
jgi:hypothetical protein